VFGTRLRVPVQWHDPRAAFSPQFKTTSTIDRNRNPGLKPGLSMQWRTSGHVDRFT
jgi:hypothetical protein